MQSKRILIVEDEPLLLQVMCRYLGLLGFEVDSCSQGGEALAYLAEKRPDAIILDNHLPDMLGLDLYRRLREKADAIPAILISAYGLEPKQLREAQALGIRGFLRKPFSFDQLKSVLKSFFKPRGIFSRPRRFIYNHPGYNLRPKHLAKQVFQKVFREGLDRGGHVHFYFDGHSDHVVLLCSRHAMGKVIAKSPECARGECIKWDTSSFARHEPEEVFLDLSQKINRVRVDAADYEMSWPTLADFLCWLELNY